MRCKGLVLLKLPPEMRALLAEAPPPVVGLYVLVVGKLLSGGGGAAASPPPLRGVRVHKLVALAGEPQREALWSLEVAELWRSVLRLLPPPAAGATTPTSA